jgi:ribonuclease VapC
VIVDSSAIVAIVREEPEVDLFVELIRSALVPRISAANYLESSIVIEGSRDALLVRGFDEFMDTAGLRVEAVTVEQVQIARAAYRDFGRGSGHPAQLNLGDCFAYALATSTREPLLYKGDDFGHTDVRSATVHR